MPQHDQVQDVFKETHRVPGVDLETPLTETLQDRWRSSIVDLVTMGRIEVSKSVKRGGTDRNIQLIGYWDVADPAFAACIYLRSKF